MSIQNDKLEACAARILREEGVPPFREHANELIERTLDPHRGTAGALARVILKDLGLTSQILRAANSAFYNHSGRPIQSIPHGITLLGWDKLRNLVSSVSYIEHYASRSPGLRELMMLSLLSAMHGREVASAVGYPNLDEAHICGLLRNLGEVLVSRHCPVEYAKIIVAVERERIPPHEACLRTLDFTWDDLASRVAEGWNMPPKVSLCLAATAAQSEPLDRCLASIANYARDLTHALYREGAGGDALALPPVIDTHGRETAIPLPTVRSIADSSLGEAHATMSTLGIPTNRLRMAQQAEKARQLLASTPVFDEAILAVLEDAAEGAAHAVEQGDFELTAVIASLLDAVRAAGFDRAVFALLNEDRSCLRGRLVSGGVADDVLNRFQFPVDRADGPLRAALQRNNDVLVDRFRDGRYDQSSLVAALDPAAFALLPIMANDGAIGCFYADRSSAAPGLEAGRRALCHVRDVMAEAIRKKSGRAAPALQSKVSRA